MRLFEGRRRRIAIAFCLFLSGCSYHRPVGVSTTRLGPEHEETLGIALGRSVHTYFLGIPSSDPIPGATQAMADAKANAGADNIVDVTVDERITYYPLTILPLVTTVETIVRGTAVRYKDPTLRPTRFMNPDGGRPATKPASPPDTTPAPGQL